MLLFSCRLRLVRSYALLEGKKAAKNMAGRLNIHYMTVLSE
jgi:hypothetical protein